MLTRILKKDLKRRKGINLILFLFITIATIFLASSVNNILVVSSAVDYYLDYAKIPDVNLITINESEKKELNHWLESESKEATGYDFGTLISPPDSGVLKLKDGKAKKLELNGATLYLGKNDPKGCRTFDESGDEYTLHSGEIALNRLTMERNDLEIGDKISVKVGSIEKKFTVKQVIKDAAFGGEMAGMCRLIFSDTDYDEFAAESRDQLIGLYYVDVKNPDKFSTELGDQGYTSVMNVVKKGTYAMMFSFDMIMASMLILIGICLILIALLVLRFTLVFTMEEEFREIGIMKATGFRDFAIKRVYLTKYLAIVVIGAATGFFSSIPVSSAMIDSVSENIVMEDSRNNVLVNVGCAIGVVMIVMAFCYMCTRKLNKVSAITAIRNGETGERFRRRRGFRLHQRGKSPVTMYLGANDLASHVKRYLVLMVTFCISFVLITIPLNTLNTMRSDEMATKFSLDPDSSVMVKRIETQSQDNYRNQKDLQKGMDRLKGELEDSGYQDVHVSAGALYFFKYGNSGTDGRINMLTIQPRGYNVDYNTYSDGTAPKLANEIAFSEDVLKNQGWEIGDWVVCKVGEKDKKFIITGTYSDYMQLGESARLNPELNCSQVIMTDYWTAMVDLKTDKTQQELKKELDKKLPQYEWATAQEVVDSNVGNIQESLNDMLIPMTGLLCAIIMLITLLMEKLFIVREKGEIAMMKSIGFRISQIRNWQIMRMICVVIASMVVAVPLSFLSNQFVLKPIFGLMGADVEIQIEPLQVYGIYPGVLLVGIILATVVATGSVKKINIRELNNLE